jgi:hypothetical protein
MYLTLTGHRQFIGKLQKLHDLIMFLVAVISEHTALPIFLSFNSYPEVKQGCLTRKGETDVFLAGPLLASCTIPAFRISRTNHTQVENN